VAHKPRPHFDGAHVETPAPTIVTSVVAKTSGVVEPPGV
jgi:hypothetical protein